MAPAEQRFEADDAFPIQVIDRLVVQLKASAHHRLPDVELDGPAHPRPGVHLGFEEPVGATPVRLRSVQREIGILQEEVGLRAVEGGDRYPDARISEDMISVEIERLLN